MRRAAHPGEDGGPSKPGTDIRAAVWIAPPLLFVNPVSILSGRAWVSPSLNLHLVHNLVAQAEASLLS